MADSIELDINIRFLGGDASLSRLDMYDGSAALFGFAKTFLISSHFLVNERVIFQAPAAKGVRCYLRTSHPGSWEQVVQIVVDNQEFLLGVGAATAKDILKDFTKLVLAQGIGRPARAITRHVRDLLARKGSDVEALKEATEGSLRDAHRTVGMDGRTSIRLISNRERIATFDEGTKRYVTDVIAESGTHDVMGNISSYNVNSRRGRIYDVALGRTVPFVLDNLVPRRARIATTWSLDRRNKGLDGDVIATVSREMTIHNEVRRYIVRDVRRR